MNKFKTDINGKLPIVLDDFRFIGESNREALKAILIGLGMGDENFIIQGIGLEEGDDPADGYTAGYIFINNEICKVDSCQSIAPAPNYKWDLDISYDAAGLKTFGNNNSHNTYEIRKAKLYGDTDPPQGAIQWNLPHLEDILRESANGVQEEWHIIGEAGNPNFADSKYSHEGSGYYYDLGFRKDLYGVYIRGTIKNSDGSGTLYLEQLFTLPTGYRPEKITSYQGHTVGVAGVNKLFSIRIFSNGEVKLSGEYHPNEKMEFGEIRFVLT